MADTGIFATTAQVQYKAGSGASSVSKAEAYINYFMFLAESYINAECRFNFSDRYASLNVDTKGILSDIASNLAAIYVVMYDMSGYATRTDAEDIINICRDAALRGLNLLKDKKAVDFIDGA